MKVKELIKKLQEQDPEKEVMIKQGQEYDYMIADTVMEKELFDDDIPDNETTIIAVVIEYN